jgi:hypothetical protein
VADFHHNVFYYYRGPSQESDKLNDPQLENNTTKALINMLKHCSPAIAVRFLNWLGIAASKRIGFELQKATIGRQRIHHVPQRLLLGLVAVPEKPGDSICDRLDGPVTGGSQPDAWIFGDDFVVLIESKVGDDLLDVNQMRGHFRKLQQTSKNRPKCLVRTWAEVHHFFESISSDLTEKDTWLVQQFTQYLEWKGMTAFSGFEEWMFEFLVSDQQDATDKTLIRRTMEGFGDKVLEGGLQKLYPAFYEDRFVGKYHPGAEHFWVAFGPTGGPSVFGKKAHQTVSLHEHGLEVFVNVEHQPAIKMLKKKLSDQADEKEFRQIVSGLPGPFRVEVDEVRVIAPMKSRGYPIATLSAGTYKPPHSGAYGLKVRSATGFEHLRRLLLEEIPLPYFSLRKRIERDRVLELSSGGGRKLVKHVLAIMEAFHPLVEFING